MRKFSMLTLIIATLLVSSAMAEGEAKAEKVAHDYVAAKKCKMCHKAEFTAWSETGHATAFDVLSDEEKKNPACAGCHTTGTDADGVLMISYTEDGRSLITELRAGGVDLPLFGTDGTGDQAMVDTDIAPDIVADIEGFKGTVPHSFVAGEGNFNNYVDALADCKTDAVCADDDATRVYGDTAYDAVWVGALAIKLAGTYDGETIKSKMAEAGKSYDGATGNKEFDEFGDVTVAAYDFYGFESGDYKVIGFFQSGGSDDSGSGAPGFELGMLLISFLAMGTVVISIRKRRN
jgi:hypothetical protein